MVDAAIVMIENAHKRLEEWEHQHPGEKLSNDTRWKIITEASVEVGPALFISLLIITLSFIPIFTLEGGEGKLFGPLAFTKTWSMAGAALLAIVAILILMGFWIRGRIPAENSNPLNRFLIRIYHPLLLKVLHWPKTTLLIALLSILTVIWPLNRVGGEFRRRSTKGDLLYMPSTLPGISAAQAADMLQKTDKLIMTVPEVARVFGKTGKAETATDSAPLEMVETTIQLKPQDQWRPGMTMERSSRSWTRPCACRGWRTCGCRRSATASTCSPPASRARLALKFPALIWPISTPSPNKLKWWRAPCRESRRH